MGRFGFAGRIGLAAALAALVSWSAGAAPAARSAKAGFRRQPAAAVKALKATVGKEFSAGLVFVNGKYLPPPYKVERFGTVVRVNGIQVTDPIVPWDEFLKTQESVKIVEEEVADEEPAEIESAAPAQVPAATAKSENIDDVNSIFEDDTVAAPALAVKAPEPPKAKPKRKVVTCTLDGEFTPNEKTAALVARVNTVRKEVDTTLRRGGYVFFGTEYSRVLGDSAAVGRLLDKLPEVMKQNSDREAFLSAARAAGMFYFPEPLLVDLYLNRTAYPVLQERRKAAKDATTWN